MAERKRIRNALSRPWEVFLRFPLTMAALCFLAGRMIAANSATGVRMDDPTVALPLCAAVFGLTASFLAQRLKGRSFLPLQAAAAVLAALFALLPSAGEASLYMRLLPAWGAAAALALYIPCVKGKADLSRVFGAHVRCAFTALAAGGALTLGAVLVASAISFLFGLRNDLAGNTAIAGLVAVIPGIYLRLLPDFEKEDDSAGPRPGLSRALIVLVLLPLMAAATLVFLAYLVKCLVILTWPVGEFGPMVLAYAAVGLSAFLLCAPYEEKSAALYRRLFPFALTAFTLLQGASIYIRIHAYGFTEPRYYLAVSAVFSLLCGLYLIFRRRARLHPLALVAACLMALSLFPIIGASAVSIRSQSARLNDLLTANNLLTDGKITQNPQTPLKARREITSVYNYFVNYGHEKALPFLSGLTADAARDGFEALFGFPMTYGYEEDNAGTTLSAYRNQALPLAVAGYESMLSVDLANPSGSLTAGGQTFSLKTASGSQGAPQLTLMDAAGATALTLDLQALMESLARTNTTGEALPPEALSVSGKGGGLHALLVLDNLRSARDAAGKFTLFSGSGILFLGVQSP